MFYAPMIAFFTWICIMSALTLKAVKAEGAGSPPAPGAGRLEATKELSATG